MRLSFHDDAMRELRLARNQVFVEGGVDAEVSFLLAMNSALRIISSFPLRAPPAKGHAEVRQFRLDRLPRVRFPWRILYRVTETGSRILAIEHAADRPNTWLYRR